MAWMEVPCLDDLRDQLNEVAPNRDKASDGSIGDTSHAAGKSSHNPDETGSPEYSDNDGKDELRARDFDSDLNASFTTEQFVQHLVMLCRSGAIWWLRYIIFNHRIWRKNGGWATETYTGASPHTEHVHVNSEFSQAADNLTTANYRLGDLVSLSDDDKTWVENTFKNALAGTLVQVEDPRSTDTPKQKKSLLTFVRYQRVEMDASAGAALAPVTAKLNALGTILASVLGKVTDDDNDTAQIIARADQIAAAEAAERAAAANAELTRHNETMAALGDLPNDIFETIQGGTTQQVADVLNLLLGDRKADVLAAMGQ